MARGRDRTGASTIGLIRRDASFEVAQGGAGGPFHDGLDLGFGLGELRFAMAAERGAALVIGYGLGQRALAAFERLHDLLEFLQSLLERLPREVIHLSHPRPPERTGSIQGMLKG